jgi:hypothetical protein
LNVFGAPYYHAHRPDLIAALTEGQDPDRVHFGKARY